jgi:hypothetical protein
MLTLLLLLLLLLNTNISIYIYIMVGPAGPTPPLAGRDLFHFHSE